MQRLRGRRDRCGDRRCLDAFDALFGKFYHFYSWKLVTGPWTPLSSIPISSVGEGSALAPGPSGTIYAFPGGGARLHWSVEDPSDTYERGGSLLAAFRVARDDLQRRIEQFVAQES